MTGEGNVGRVGKWNHLRPPRGQPTPCPECGTPVESVKPTDSNAGACLVLWPCRHVYLVSELMDWMQA